MFEVSLILALTILGGIFARMDGGGKPQGLPELIERLLCMSFFLVACATFCGWWSVFSLLGMIGLATGHGQYFPEVKIKKIDPEKVDPVVSLFFGPDPRVLTPTLCAVKKYGTTRLYLRCAFGMFITGTLVGLPSCVLSLVFGNYEAALLFALTGVVKSAAYIAAFALTKKNEHAEFINGAGRSILAILVLLG